MSGLRSSHLLLWPHKAAHTYGKRDEHAVLGRKGGREDRRGGNKHRGFSISQALTNLGPSDFHLSLILREVVLQ